MRFTLGFSCNTAAFTGDADDADATYARDAEICAVLHQLLSRFQDPIPENGRVTDSNGNDIGGFRLED